MSRGGWILFGLAIALAVTARFTSAADEKEEGFKVIFDGKSLDGWKGGQNADTFKLQNGEIVAHGQTAHLFYVGDPQPFKNFEVRVDVMTEPNSNGRGEFPSEHEENNRGE